jgi:hypothetical protein
MVVVSAAIELGVGILRQRHPGAEAPVRSSDRQLASPHWRRGSDKDRYIHGRDDPAMNTFDAIPLFGMAVS